ncbi:MAG: ATP-dependent metallopeptidase FtsH/Yme1/Tma family protein [Epulopiscium sp.]|nr:ATP-dependent metallopeptidase FtsH/Yme1/Tma family protein [Candidatus Epulonipiscium sp.]
MQKYRKIAIISAVLILILLLGMLYINKKERKNEITYHDFLQYIEENRIEKVIIGNESKLKVKIKNEEKFYKVENPRNPSLKETLLLQNIIVEENEANSVSTILQGLLIIAFFTLGFWYVQRIWKKQQPKYSMAMNIEDSREQQQKMTCFHDVAGNEEAKESVQDVVDFIKNPEKYSKYGARMPRGIIFYGPPGTGKTLMAKAIAGEANVPFFAVSGSDFVQMYVGVGASRIRDLFKKARTEKKAVIFIDEIDALGKKRTGGSVGGGNDERDQTLNALLTEMSGFYEDEGIVVIAATNRLDILDEALLRPGRFDRHIEIGLPDVAGREKILRIHGKNKPLDPHIDLKKLAQQTVYFSGAMLENLLNEGAMIAAKKNGEMIHWEDIDQAFYTVVAGSAKKDRSGILEKDQKITAYHEAGHALITKLVAPENRVSKVTIIPSTKGAGGFSMNIPPDKMYYTKKELEHQIQVYLAGRIAEEIIFGTDEITTGASNDIEKATSLLKDYIMEYGMSKEAGLLNINVLLEMGQKQIVQQTLFEECKKQMNSLYEKTKNLLIKNKEMLDRIAKELLRKESLVEEELDQLLQVSNLHY